MSNNRMRVEIPRNAGDLIDLALSINKKHQDDGPLSPLLSLKDRTWETEGSNALNCKQKHEEAEGLKRRSEELYKERDILLEDLDTIVKASRDVLLGINRDNPRRLIEWGFRVIESPVRKVNAGTSKNNK